MPVGQSLLENIKNDRYFLAMGRIAGVSAEETRQRLLETAADVFGRLGYDGASISDITSEAGVSSGAIYARYASKAELFVATLRAHGDGEVRRLLGGDNGVDFASFLLARGRRCPHRTDTERTLLIEAVAAAKRHPDVAEVLTASIAHREEQLTELLPGRAGAGRGGCRICRRRRWCGSR